VLRGISGTAHAQECHHQHSRGNLETILVLKLLLFQEIKLNFLKVYLTVNLNGAFCGGVEYPGLCWVIACEEDGVEYPA
jgi:hypothetical protein